MLTKAEKDRNELIKKKIKLHAEMMLREPGAKERCQEYLVSLGIYNPDGTLHKDYGGE